MAKNAPVGNNHRVGAVRERSQVHNPHNDRWVKRDTDTGEFMDQKSDKAPFKNWAAFDVLAHLHRTD
jgi:hypothetical protein